MCDFLTQELLPWIQERYSVTHDSQQTIIGGISLGGLAAVFAGFRHPDAFGNILSQSGSFYWMPEGEAEDEWLTRQFANNPTLPLRFYLEVGLLENGLGPFPTNLRANRHLRTVLEAKGYTLEYAEFNGGHEMLTWRGTLVNGLLALIGTDSNK
jgi:enterochelin esterase family protein